MGRQTPPTSKIRNWPGYNQALKRRRSLMIWFDPAMTWEATPTGQRGRQPDCSNAAIQTGLTMKVLFGILRRDGQKITQGARDEASPSRQAMAQICAAADGNTDAKAVPEHEE